MPASPAPAANPRKPQTRIKVPPAGRRPMAFVLVDPGGYRTDTALAKWIQRGIDFVSMLPAKKRTTSAQGVGEVIGAYFKIRLMC